MILARFSKDKPIIKHSGNYIYNLMLTGCIMKEMAEALMLDRGCSYEDAMKFVCELPNKFIYEKDGKDITFEISNKI